MSIAEEQAPSYQDLATTMRRLSELRGDWSGYPMPIDGLKLQVSRGFPYQGMNGFSFSDEPDQDIEEADSQIVNSWLCVSRGFRVMLYFNAEHRIRHVVIPAATPGERLTYAINTLGASRAWNVNAELTAMLRLRELVTPVAFNYYILTGGFLESSTRSTITYWFRKNRPTVALKSRDHGVCISAILCLHPLGYYQESYAGVMVPSDDVIAHLLLMRADEHKFWSKANQHCSWSENCGL
jgi:hypothetical protein